MIINFIHPKEVKGFIALAQFLRQPLIGKGHITLLYPGSADRLEHALEIIKIVCDQPSNVSIHLVDPLLSLTVLEKKCVGLDHVDVHAYQENFGPQHIPEQLTMYFERAFDLFREEWMIPNVVDKLVAGGLFITDAQISHPALEAIPLAPATKDIGFYPFFGIYKKNS